MNYFWKKDEVLAKARCEDDVCLLCGLRSRSPREVVHAGCCLRNRNWARSQGLPRARLGLIVEPLGGPSLLPLLAPRVGAYGFRYHAAGGVDDRPEASGCGVAGTSTVSSGTAPSAARKSGRVHSAGRPADWSSSRISCPRRSTPAPFLTLRSTFQPWPSSRWTVSTNSSPGINSARCHSKICRTTASPIAFQNGDLPAELLGDLRALTWQVKTPLAIRSSSLLEDALERPFAGVYATKMIPNNQFDPDMRFRLLVEAIKFVYASTYFREARDYIRTTGRQSQRRENGGDHPGSGRPAETKIAFTPTSPGWPVPTIFLRLSLARPDEGIVTLALGLGKTIVDGGTAWTFSPAYPKKPPPYASVQELLKDTQTEFWAVNMGTPPAYDPVSETEYLVRCHVADTEAEQVLRFVASTYDPESDRVTPGTGGRGAADLELRSAAGAGVVSAERPDEGASAQAAENVVHAKVEIEFALTIHERGGERPRARLGFLQVRPMAVSRSTGGRAPWKIISDSRAIVASDMVMGNGAC